MKVVKLQFQAPVHFGGKRLSDANQTISADTLFSALVIEAVQQSLPLEHLLKELVFTDLFPYVQDTYYLPKPLIRIETKKGDESGYKAFKKLTYIPMEMYAHYLKGEVDSKQAQKMATALQLGKASLSTKVSLSTVDQGGESEPYAVGSFTFAPDAGLYFLLKGTDAAVKQLEELMSTLQYAGLGGKRSAGYGQFRYSIEEGGAFTSLLNQKGTTHILLSTAMAKEEELATCLEDARYVLKKRAGFIQSTNYDTQLVKKRDFYAFSSGSTFKNQFKGAIFDVSQNGQHPVYRYAKAFWLEEKL